MSLTKKICKLKKKQNTQLTLLTEPNQEGGEDYSQGLAKSTFTSKNTRYRSQGNCRKIGVPATTNNHRMSVIT